MLKELIQIEVFLKIEISGDRNASGKMHLFSALLNSDLSTRCNRWMLHNLCVFFLKKIVKQGLLEEDIVEKNIPTPSFYLEAEG